MGFREVAVFDCAQPELNPKLPDKIPLRPHLTTSTLSPLGNHNSQAFRARMRRLTNAAGLSSPAAFIQAIGKQFPNSDIAVPKADIMRHIDRRYRQVLGYLRLDRYIVLTLKGGNKFDDYLLLCLPQSVTWVVLTVGVCGTEKTVKSLGPDDFFGPQAQDGFEFEARGPYRPITPVREKIVALTPENMFSEIYRTVLPDSEKNDLWRRVLRRDEAIKKKKAAGQKGQVNPDFGLWALEHNINPTYYNQRRKAEHRRIAAKHSKK